MLNELFAWSRRLMKAYLLKESLDRLWNYSYPGAMMRYVQQWIDQLHWQRLQPMEKLGRMLPNHLQGILNYCEHKVPLGVPGSYYKIGLNPSFDSEKTSVPGSTSMWVRMKSRRVRKTRSWFVITLTPLARLKSATWKGSRTQRKTV